MPLEEEEEGVEDDPDLQPLDSFEDEDDDDDDDENEYEDGDENDEEDKEDEEDQREAVREKPKKRPKQFQEPASDNDHDEAFTDDGSAEEDAWTWNLTKIRLHKFQGPKPGLTFNGRAFTAVQFFFTFFPLTIITKLVEWTNSRLRAMNKAATTLED